MFSLNLNVKNYGADGTLILSGNYIVLSLLPTPEQNPSLDQKSYLLCQGEVVR